MNCLDYSSVFLLLDQYHQNCLESANTNYECLLNLATSQDSKSSTQTQYCFLNNLINLELVINDMKNLQMDHVFHLKIDGYLFPSELTVQNVFAATCASFETSPEICLFKDNKYTVLPNASAMNEMRREKIKVLLVLCSVALVVLLGFTGVSLYLIYKKTYQRAMAQQMDKVVQEYLSHYQSIEGA